MSVVPTHKHTNGADLKTIKTKKSQRFIKTDYLVKTI